VNLTPLHCAAHEGHADVVRALVAAGAALNAKVRLRGGSPG
jgi:ankyrin repeat protein